MAPASVSTNGVGFNEGGYWEEGGSAMSFAGLRACLGALCALAMLASCAAPRERGGAENQLPVRVSVRDVSYPPPSDHGAGWATAVLLGWTGLDVSPSDLAPFFGGDNPHRAAVRAVRRHGRLAYPLEDWSAILGELAAGHPVLVGIDEGDGRSPASMVAVGYDLAEGWVMTHSSQVAQERHALARLGETWVKGGAWALVVLPPGDLPATVEEDDYLEAAAGLEKDGPAWEAVIALDSALALWNDSVQALVGLGRSLFALGDRKGAEEAFAAASSLTDDPGIRRWRWAILQAGLSSTAEGGGPRGAGAARN